MAEVLGRIDRPPVEKYKEARKLYLVPLVYAGKESPQEFVERVELYWRQAQEQLNKLESKMGRINKIYHESVFFAGEQGLSVVEKINEKGYPLIKSKCEKGAELQATEDMDLFAESMDWGNCLRVVMSNNVFQKVSEFYREVTEKRYNYISSRIDETLKEKETGVLFISEGHSVQFPPTVQVFYISPPALDEISRWFREKTEKDEK